MTPSVAVLRRHLVFLRELGLLPPDVLEQDVDDPNAVLTEACAVIFLLDAERRRAEKLRAEAGRRHGHGPGRGRVLWLQEELASLRSAVAAAREVGDAP